MKEPLLARDAKAFAAQFRIDKSAAGRNSCTLADGLRALIEVMQQAHVKCEVDMSPAVSPEVSFKLRKSSQFFQSLFFKYFLISSVEDGFGHLSPPLSLQKKTALETSYMRT